MAAQILEGVVERQVAVAGKPCVTAYLVAGDLSAPAATPLVCIHGGPGMGSTYMTNLLSLAGPRRPVVLYDQLGCGKSTRLPEKAGDATFWTEDLFLDELGAVLEHLDLGPKPYDLLGHSWGGYVASSWAARRPPGLRRLIAWSPVPDVALWTKGNLRLRDGLSPQSKDTVTRFEAEGIAAAASKDAPTPTVSLDEYLAAMAEFNAKYLCRADPPPEPLTQMMASFLQDMTVYNTLFGPMQCTPTGCAKDWSVVDRLHLIEVPTLITNTRWDKTTDESLQVMFDRINRVKWERLEEGSHFTNLDAQEAFFSAITRFLGD